MGGLDQNPRGDELEDTPYGEEDDPPVGLVGVEVFHEGVGHSLFCFPPLFSLLVIIACAFSGRVSPARVCWVLVSFW